ncbi:MAG: tetratricopeptide repeat protein [candidate division Zixibacteria bacterium]|nr:tetratricopeptide repeat protein [candidate division Zixibacteria bacterium]
MRRPVKQVRAVSRQRSTHTIAYPKERMVQNLSHRMFERFALFIMLCLCAVMLMGSDVCAQDELSETDTLTTDVVWLRSYEQALDEAMVGRQRIMAEFYTDWCRWCRTLEDSTLVHPAVEALADSFVFLRVNAELDTSLASQFGINAYPTVLLMDGSGSEAGRIVGYVPPDEFIARVEQYVRGEGTLWALEKQNRERPSDPETMYLLGRKYMERGQHSDAQTMLEKMIQQDQDNNTGFADDAQFAIAMMFRRDRQWFKAIESFRLFIEKFPDSELREDAELYIPWLNARAGDNEAALEQYNEFLDDHGGSSEADWVREQISRLEAGQEPSEKDEGHSSSDDESDG